MIFVPSFSNIPCLLKSMNINVMIARGWGGTEGGVGGGGKGYRGTNGDGQRLGC